MIIKLFIKKQLSITNNQEFEVMTKNDLLIFQIHVLCH